MDKEKPNPNPNWVEGLNLDLDFDYGWRKVSLKLYRETYSGNGNFRPEYLLKFPEDDRFRTRILRLAIEHSKEKLFSANPRSFGVKRLFGEREEGIKVDFIPDLKSGEGSENYDALIFLRHKKLNEEKFRETLVRITNLTNNLLRWLEIPEIPDFGTSI